jgi:hypothetical protein
MVRQAEQRQRQAISDYNTAVRRHNSEVKRAVADYNRQVSAHNSKVRTNRQRLQLELARLESRPPTARVVTYRVSTLSLRESLGRVTESSWPTDGHLFDLAQGEAANSVAVLNVLDGAAPISSPTDELQLQDNLIVGELDDFALDLRQRWAGALFSLDPRNPDAARHFCTSSREILGAILEAEAPDTAVFSVAPDAPRTPQGRPTRRARIGYCLGRRGRDLASLSDFIDDDIANVVDLFQTFNDGAHGSAGHFTVAELLTVKVRVEDAIRFLHAAVKG